MSTLLNVANTKVRGRVFRTSYGTEAVILSANRVWDLEYKQFTTMDYVIPIPIRTAKYNENPEYYKDSGRDETKVRGVWFDRTGKRKVRKI